ncbi:vWA domain-containing protein [Sorangium sp. So ce1000]|uniref:vWA domain-containing protein n=1 Tax=Sorangium sp. So ce1000 TaxID=3133325 RepID=UPI003F62B66C
MRLESLHITSLAAMVGLAAALALHGACAPDSGAGLISSYSSSDGTGSGGTFDPDGGLSTDAAVDTFDPDAACGLVTEEASAVPLNLYIMMDKSSSMRGDDPMVADKWTSAKAGLTAFVNSARFAGVRVALRFFPRAADDVPACDQEAYKAPLVPFGPLPENAGAIVAAMEDESPDGASTPIYPALGGALLQGIEVAKNRPGEASAVLLVTDGQPQGPAPQCAGVNPEDPAAIAKLAESGARYRPAVRTFVIGLPGVNQAFANQVAAAGGTDAAVLVGATNIAVEFQDALAKVTGQALPCEVEVPSQVAGGQVAFNDVNVLFGLDGAPQEILPQRPGCDGPGWRYDNPASPTALVLCPDTCEAARSASVAKIQILLGCETVIL